MTKSQFFLILFFFMLAMNALAENKKISFVTTMITGFSYRQGYQLYQRELTRFTTDAQIPFQFFHYTHGDKMADIFKSLKGFDCINGQESLESKNTRFIIYLTSWGANKAILLAQEFKKRCGRAVDLFVILDGVAKPSLKPSYSTPEALSCVNYYQNKSRLRGAPIAHCENINLTYLCDENLQDTKEVFDCHRKLHVLRSAKMMVYDRLQSFILEAQ